MRYKLLGKSGLRVSELCLGTMTFGDSWGWGANKEESKRIFDAYAEAGGNFIDTANLYTNGESERFIGEFVQGEREHFVVATKYTNAPPGTDPNAAGNQRKNLVQSINASLKRLGVDYIDIYWVHAWDPMTPVEELMRALDDQVRQGKVLYVGISDAPAWIVSRANAIAESRGWTPFISLQVEYNLAQRTPERELLPMARALDVGVTAWSPLASGLLSGKYTRGVNGEERRLSKMSREEPDERSLRIAWEVDALADELGVPSAQVALAWVRQHPNVIPILGARTVSQLQSNLQSLEVTLTSDQLERLNDVSRIELGFPHDFLRQDGPRAFAYGGMLEQIDDPRQLAELV
jgi:aryl-alcohol dehydrogenase-like predicted oxidoreductase